MWEHTGHCHEWSASLLSYDRQASWLSGAGCLLALSRQAIQQPLHTDEHADARLLACQSARSLARDIKLAAFRAALCEAATASYEIRDNYHAAPTTTINTIGSDARHTQSHSLAS